MTFKPTTVANANQLTNE